MQIESGQEHLLATACSDNSICVWDVRKLSQGGKPVSSVTHSLTCQSAYFAPDGRLTLPGSRGKCTQKCPLSRKCVLTVDVYLCERPKGAAGL